MSKSCDNLKHNKLVILSQSKNFILSRWPKNSLDIFVILCIPDFCVTIFHMQSIHLYTTPVISHSLSSNNIRESDELLTACFYSSFLWKFSVSNWAFFHTIRNAQVLFPLNISKKVRKKSLHQYSFLPCLPGDKILTKLLTAQHLQWYQL